MGNRSSIYEHRGATVRVDRDWDQDGSSHKLEYTATLPDGRTVIADLDPYRASEREVNEWIDNELEAVNGSVHGMADRVPMVSVDTSRNGDGVCSSRVVCE